MWKQCMFENNKAAFPRLYVCMCHKQVIKGFMSLKQHGTSMKGSPPLCSLAMTEILSRRSWQDTSFPHHAAWDECNKQVHHQPKKTHIETTPRKENKKQNRKRNGAGQWLVVISPQISRQYISPRRLLCTQSSSPSDSALTCTCMLMPLSPICQSARSLMGKETSTTAMQKVTAMALVKRLTAKPRQLLPTTRAPVDFLYPCFTASRCKNDISGIEAATRRL